MVLRRVAYEDWSTLQLKNVQKTVASVTIVHQNLSSCRCEKKISRFYREPDAWDHEWSDFVRSDFLGILLRRCTIRVARETFSSFPNPREKGRRFITRENRIRFTFKSFLPEKWDKKWKDFWEIWETEKLHKTEGAEINKLDSHVLRFPTLPVALHHVESLGSCFISPKILHHRITQQTDSGFHVIRTASCAHIVARWNRLTRHARFTLARASTRARLFLLSTFLRRFCLQFRSGASTITTDRALFRLMIAFVSTLSNKFSVRQTRLNW